MARRRTNNRNTFRVDLPVVRVYPRVRTALQLIEDRRVFHPEGTFRSPLSVSSPKRSRLVVRKANFGPVKSRISTMPSTLGFKVPERVALCVRRKERKEVLIAKRRSGRGTRKRRTYWSAVSC